ncbi:uncharacterized protein LOC126661543 [Mercurialis annua]|uniref:uncharacterized protein LOC126661543 n=1 Tax=Mercurialis annua TaxID=3986 RepID=UPI00215E4E35|nr:uncharacterized protein LOC126661543 [Mercurialis annua]
MAEMVEQLLDIDGTGWDVDLVKDVFEEEDVQQILSVPVSNRDVSDRWWWKFEPKGKFSVKSFYKAVCGELTYQPDSVWGKIWGIKAPLNIRSFLWRLCAGVDVNGGSGLSIVDWCRDWLSRLDDEEASVASYVCWSLWLNRNFAVWKNKLGSAQEVVDQANFQLASWKVANSSSVHLRTAKVFKEDGSSVWKAPPRGWLKVNTDAVVYPGRQSFGMGVVVRDWLGNIIQARSRCSFGSFSPRMAEIMGVREALSWLKDFDKIIIDSDAMDVVLDVRNPSCSDSDLLVEDCAELAKQFDNIKFVFVRRSANQAAHVLAQYASSILGLQGWFYNFPEFLATVTVSDLIE